MSQEIRKEKIRKLRELESLGVDPYPASLRFERQPINSVREAKLDNSVAVAGRITAKRGHGGIFFIDLADGSATIQAAFRENSFSENQWKIFNLVDPGDHIEVHGTLFLTMTGELTIDVTDFNLLSKALRPLPDPHEGFRDKELRLRKRYLDLLVNESTRQVFAIRHQLTREIRNFLDREGLTEVETPILQPLPGGANAKPFVTEIQALDARAYLRVASELYLKRLMTTGFKGVYDIAKDFRNEGIDQTHFPEFTMLEAYIAYFGYHQMMDLAEAMIKELAHKILGSSKIQLATQIIDLNIRWPRVPMTEIIKQMIDLEIEHSTDDQILQHKFGTSTNHHSVRDGLTQAGMNPTELSRGELIFAIFNKLTTVKGPVWVIDYPIEISPLAKQHPTKKDFTERFELYIGGNEIIDGWTELNDPLAQRARFESEHNRNFDATEIAQPIDTDYLEAIEYGMPPMAGIGIGIDRLTMLFSNTWSIQETILFPFKKPTD